MKKLYLRITLITVFGVWFVGFIALSGRTEAMEAPLDDILTDEIETQSIIHALQYRVIDAEYSRKLNRIITVSSTPKNRLNIYNPQMRINRAVDLPLEPSSVSVSPDGLYAAVGHDGWISYVNLKTATVEKTLPVTTDVLDVVLAGNGFVYAFPRVDQWENIRCVNIETEKETMSTGFIYAGTVAKLHPNGKAIYGANNGLSPSDIEKYSIVNGTASYLYDSPYHGDYAICGDLWISEDGFRIFTKCGNVFRASNKRSEDMTYNGSLKGLSLVKHLSHSTAANKVAVISGNDTKIQLYSYKFLVLDKAEILPKFVVNNKAYPGHGKFVFFNSTGSKYFVVTQADLTAGLLFDYGVVTYCRDTGAAVIKGSVKEDAGAGADVMITLSGPDTCANITTTTTNATGRYRFGNLAKGTYTVAPSKSGCQFRPKSQTVTIEDGELIVRFKAQCS